jgi:hypothetical protein
MDQDRFDRFTRTMAEGASRRQVLRQMIGGAMGGVLALKGVRSAGAAPAGKVNICHHTGSASNPFEYISVSQNAVAAHTAHGDVINPDLMNDVNNCGGCGISCDDGNLCTHNICSGGVCSNPAVDCSGAGDHCNVGTCDPGTGGCYADPAPLEGASCDDGVNCTENDVCTAGVCGGSPIDCSGEDDACNVGVCDEATGGCVKDPAPLNGATCDDGVNCTENDVCTNGTCGGTAVDCSGENDQCNTGVCLEADGSCGTVPANENDPCTTAVGVDGTCVAGTCEPVCGSLTGVISSSATGDPISGATVEVGALSTTTGGDGSYSFACVEAGDYTVQASAAGFNDNAAPATITAGANTNVNISLLPITNASQITVLLNWNSQPGDLDSHMSGPDGGAGRFHMAYYNQNPTSFVSLDVDDVDGNGPETTTVIESVGGNFVAGEYRYWVHNYSTVPEFDVSGARVQLLQDGVPVATFLVSAAAGNQADDIWHVVNFTLDANGIVGAPTAVQTLQPGNSGTVL